MDIRIVSGLLLSLRQMHRRESWTRQQIEAYQANALLRLRKYAYARSTFYRQFHKGLYDRPLQELPVLTKAILMQHFDELVTDPTIHLQEVEEHVRNLRGDEKFLGRYWVCTTSGSTGRRGIFLFNRSEWITILASFARAHEWAGVRVNLNHRMKMASVASTSLWHMSARFGATLRSRWLPALRLNASEPFNTIVEQLNAYQPDILVAYPSMAGTLAKAQPAGHLHISPRAIYTSSEVLTDETRRFIEEAWGKNLFNQYAATEAGGMAAECEQHRGMHLFEDLAITEVVDDDYRPVPPGEYGDKILITVLSSRTQPLIRYEITDSVRLSKELCPCGRSYALIEDIQGRTEDTIWLSSPVGDEVSIHPIVFYRAQEPVPAGSWQVVQETDGLHILLTDVREGFSEDTLLFELRQAIEAQGAIAPPIMIQLVPAIPRGSTGKAPLIKSSLRR